MTTVHAQNHAHRTAEATWDEQVAHTLGMVPETPFHAHPVAPAATPRHPSSPPDVTRYRWTADRRKVA